jgi:hypothetical protein
MPLRSGFGSVGAIGICTEAEMPAIGDPLAVARTVELEEGPGDISSANSLSVVHL